MMGKPQFCRTVLTVAVSFIIAHGNNYVTGTKTEGDTVPDGKQIVFKTAEEDSKPASENIIGFLHAINSSISNLSNRVEALESKVAVLGRNSQNDSIQRKGPQLNLGELETTLGKLEGQNSNLQKSMAGLSSEFAAGLRAVRTTTEPKEPTVTVVDITGLRKNKTNLTSEVLTEDEGKDIISKLVSDYKVKLYSGENYTGESLELNFTSSNRKGGCQTVERFNKKVESVDSSGKCVRLFEGGACEGWSMAVYPGNDNSWKSSKSKLQPINSVGPCLSYEFEIDAAEGRIIKNSSDLIHYIPDLIEFSSEGKYANATEAEVDPLYEAAYVLGPHNRVEYIRAWAYGYFPNVTQPNPTEEEMKFYNSLEKKPGDILGYAIPYSIRGLINETYNIFPQSPSCRDEWFQKVSTLGAYVIDGKGGKAGIVEVNFAYESDKHTRPYAFYYHITHRGGSMVADEIDVAYGRILN